MIDTNNNGIFTIIMGVFIAILGASAKYLGGLHKSKFSHVIFWSNIFISGFIGLIIALVCDEFDVSINLACVAAGIGGYAGHALMDRIAAKFELIIAKKIDSTLN
jgi:hypothetical protein